jgi:hypothetical protein
MWTGGRVRQNACLLSMSVLAFGDDVARLAYVPVTRITRVKRRISRGGDQ